MPIMRAMGVVKALVIHHSAGPSGSVPVFREEHKAKGWADIGYHWVIGNGHGQRDGDCERGRSEEFEGSAVFGNNSGKLHVCLVGNFENTEPTKKQLDTLGQWLLHRLVKHGRLEVLGHNEAAIEGHGTLCPGEWLRIRLSAVRSWCNLAQAGSPISLSDYLTHPSHGNAPAASHKPTVAPSAPAPPAAPTHKPITVEVHVKGYMNDQARAVVKAAGVMLDNDAFVKLADLVDGLAWDTFGHDKDTDTLKVSTKRAVRGSMTPQERQDAEDARLDAQNANRKLLQ